TSIKRVSTGLSLSSSFKITSTIISSRFHAFLSAYIRKVMAVHEPNEAVSNSDGLKPLSVPPKSMGSSAIISLLAERTTGLYLSCLGIAVVCAIFIFLMNNQGEEQIRFHSELSGIFVPANRVLLCQSILCLS